MDIKIAGITEEIMKVALGQAKDGRLHILGEMARRSAAGRSRLRLRPAHHDHADPDRQDPRHHRPGGKMIREICEVPAHKIDIDDDGT